MIRKLRLLVMALLVVSLSNFVYADGEKIGSIEFRNLNTLPEGLIRSKLLIKEGDEYTTKKISDNYLHLRDLSYIDDLNVYTTVNGNTVDLVFEIDEAMNAAQLAQQEESGFSEDTLKEKTEFKIESVSIEGLKTISEEELLSKLPLEIGEYFVPQNAIDSARILFETGKFSKIGQPEVLRNQADTVSIVYSVVENPAVTSINIEGNTLYTEEDLISALGINVGDILDISKIRKNDNGIINKYNEDGYVLAKIEDMKISDSGGLIISLSEGVVSDIDYRRVSRKKDSERRTEKDASLRTKDFVFERGTLLQKGEIFQKDKFEKSLKEIYRTGLFTSVVPSFKKDPNDPEGNVIELLIEERPTASINANVSYGTAVGVVGGVDFKDSNFLGRQWDFTSKVEISSEGSRVFELGLFDPWIKGTERVQAGVTIYRTEFQDDDAEGDDLKDVTKTGIRGTLGKGLNSDIYVRTALRYEKINEEYGDTSLGLDEKYDLIALTPSITYDTRDNRFNAKNGLYANLRYEYGYILDNSEDYNQLEADVRGYHKTFFGDRNTMAYRMVAGTTGSSTPRALQFNVGGANSIRGYEYGDIEGFDEFYVQIENRTQITKGIQLVAFFDAGDAWENEAERSPSDDAWDFSDIKKGYGVGLRLETPVGPLRFDYAWPMDGIDGEDKGSGQFYFNFGQSF